MNTAKEELTKLGKCLEWSSEPLTFVDIEPPEKLVARLLDDGVYTPFMRMEVATRHKQRLLESGVIESSMQKVSQQFETEDGYIVKPLSGSVSMEVPREWRRSRMAENKGLFEGETQSLTDSRYILDGRSGDSAGCLQLKDQQAIEAEL